MKKKLKIFLIVCLLLIVLLCIYALLAKTGLFFKNDNSKDIVISVNVTAPGQTLKINKYFKNDYTVDRGDGSPVQKKWVKEIDGDWGDREYWTHNYKKNGKYTVRLSLSHGAYRWKFDCNSSSLIPKYGTTVSDVKIVSMPSLADGFGDSATNPGDCFFSNFNSEGIITSLPEGSFDTSNITIAGSRFFCGFNIHSWADRYLGLKKLPEGSFDTSNITIVEDNFFAEFNENGGITKLPEGSFNLSSITKAGLRFFSYFNANGALTELPEGSFDISNITTVGSSFFDGFNYNGALTELPEGSFDISNIRERGTSFFGSFNGDHGALKDVPNFLNIRKKQIGEEIFYDKNSKTNIVINVQVNQANQKIMINKYFSNEYNVDWGDGLIEWLIEDTIHSYEKTGTYDIILSLREGAERWTFRSLLKPLVPKRFTTVTGVKITSMPSLADGFGDSATNPGDCFFSQFNAEGIITSLPEGSFDTSSITTVGNDFFAYFNRKGALTSLPEGSFDTSNITTVENGFFAWFNRWGAIIELPEGSFDTSNITSVENCSFCSGALKELLLQQSMK